MHLNPKKFLHGLLYLAPLALLALASCGGGGGGGGSTPVATTVTVPAAPTNVVATNVSGCSVRIQISWIASAGATGYNVYRSIASPVTTSSTKLTSSTPVPASPFVDTTAVASHTYYYAVTAINSAGVSPISATTSATTPAATATTCTKLGGSLQGVTLSLTGTVTTAAGTSGVNSFADGTGTNAEFNNPAGIASDGVNIYIADTSNNRIRQYSIATGAVTTIAGTGANGHADGPGTSAQFNLPRGITTDGTNLYVADTGNNTIRMIASPSTSPTVSTIAGSAIALAGSTNNLTGTSASFNNPNGITYDGKGSLYVADTSNNLVRQISLTSPYAVSTYAGNGTAGFTDNTTGLSAEFNSPQGITTDGTNLYVADTSNCAIRQIVIGSAAVSTIVGGGSGACGFSNTNPVRFNLPQGITTDGTNLYVADTVNYVIRKIAPPYISPTVTTVAGSVGITGSTDATGTAASFYQPFGITTDGSYLYDADFGKSTIRRIQ